MSPMKPMKDKGKGRLGGDFIAHSLLEFISQAGLPPSPLTPACAPLPHLPALEGTPWAGPW